MFLIYLHYRPFQHQLSLRIYLNVSAFVPDKAPISKRDTAYGCITLNRFVNGAVKSADDKSAADAAAAGIWLENAQDLRPDLWYPVSARLAAADSNYGQLSADKVVLIIKHNASAAGSPVDGRYGADTDKVFDFVNIHPNTSAHQCVLYSRCLYHVAP